MRSRVHVLAQATRHTSTQCVCKLHPDFQSEQLVQFCDLYTGVQVGWERVGTAFPHLFAIATILQNLDFSFQFYA